jgi:16S rRNA (guanine527-N7)-methyltransferase
MDIILKYFPDLDSEKISAFGKLSSLYELYNERVNVISRKDIQHIYLHHVLHSLSICKFIHWNTNCRILDLGTGGGFPAIPLAIMYPEIQFTAIDGTGKKIKVVQEIAQSLQLKNIKAVHLRAEDCKEKFHFVISRAVTRLNQLCILAKPLIKKVSITAQPNGIIAYKGGNLTEEIKEIKSKAYYEIWDIYDVLHEDYFIEKALVYLQLHE